MIRDKLYTIKIASNAEFFEVVPRTVNFEVSEQDKYATNKTQMEVRIEELRRESGDDSSWLFKGYATTKRNKAPPIAVKGFYSTESKDGWIKTE